MVPTSAPGHLLASAVGSTRCNNGTSYRTGYFDYQDYRGNFRRTPAGRIPSAFQFSKSSRSGWRRESRPQLLKFALPLVAGTGRQFSGVETVRWHG